MSKAEAKRFDAPDEVRPHYGIPSAGRNCVSYRPGHQVHWIQAKQAHEPGQPIIAVSVLRCDGLVDHPLPGPARDDVDLQLCLSEYLGGGGRAQWRPRFHVLSVNGTLFNLTEPDAPGSAETLPASGVVVASYAVGGSAIHTLTQMANGLGCNRYPRRAGCRRTSSPV